MKKRYKKADPSRMAPEERKKYKKHLLYVRKYTRLKREYERRRREGLIDLTLSFDEFRGSTNPDPDVEAARKDVTASDSPSPVVQMLRRLLREAEGIDRRQSELRDQISKVIGKSYEQIKKS